jgi:hypothetical protein
MSASGRFRAWRDVRLESAFGSKADLAALKCDFRFTPQGGHPADGLGCPKSAHNRKSLLFLFDYLISAGKQCRRDFEAECFGCLEID